MTYRERLHKVLDLCIDRYGEDTTFHADVRAIMAECRARDMPVNETTERRITALHFLDLELRDPTQHI